MKSRLTPDQTDEALRELGVDPAEFAQVQRAPTHQEAVARLSVFKVKVKKKYHEAARRLHPDLNEGDNAKKELFWLCTQVHEQIQELRLQRPAQVAPLRMRNGRLTINIKVKRG